jgi:YVTN family beta-propeller protein
MSVVDKGQAAPFVYAANADSDDVTVIDAATNTVATTIDVENEPRNPAVSPDGSRVYVPNRHSDTVSVISGLTNTIITTIDDDDFDEPYSAAVSPDGSRVYIANKEGGGSTTGSLTVINAQNNTVITTIDDMCFVSPEWVVVNPAGTRAYVVNRQGDSVCVVDTASNTVIDDIPVGSEPRSAVVTCDGAFVYVANSQGGPDVSKIDTSDGSTDDINFTSGFPRNMAITPDCAKIYVGLQSANVGLILTANDATSLIAVPSGDSTYAVAVIADGSRAYVTDEDDNEIEVIDVATDTVLTTAGLPIPAGSTPRGIATGGGSRTSAPAPALSPLLLLVAAGALFGLGVSAARRRSLNA